MGIIREKDGTTRFICDICQAEYDDVAKGNWDEARLVSVRAREAGWHFNRREALYPDCAPSVAYTLGREGLP
jgi:hypothetical protein